MFACRELQNPIAHAFSILLLFTSTACLELSDTAEPEGCQTHTKGFCMRDMVSFLQKELRFNTINSKHKKADLHIEARKSAVVPGAIVMVGSRENIEDSVLADACSRIMPLLKAHGVNRANIRFITDQSCPEQFHVLDGDASAQAKVEMSKWLEPDVDYSLESDTMVSKMSPLTGKKVFATDAQSVVALIQGIAQRSLTGSATCLNMPEEVTNLLVYFSGHSTVTDGVEFGESRVLMGPASWREVLIASGYDRRLFLVDACYSGSNFDDFLPRIINKQEVQNESQPIAQNIEAVAITSHAPEDNCKFPRADSCGGIDGGHFTMGLMQVLSLLDSSTNHTENPPVGDLLNISWLNASSCLQESVRQGHVQDDWKPTFYGKIDSLLRFTLSSFGLADIHA